MMNHNSPRERTGYHPPVRVTDDERHVHVSVGLPGVVEEQIRIDLEKTSLTVSVAADGKTLRKVIRIPRGARFFTKKFSDGVLDIVLEKPLP